MPRPIVHTGVKCPDCGRPDANLERFEDTSPYLVVKHDFCGHFSHFANLIKEELISQGISSNILNHSDKLYLQKTLSFDLSGANGIPKLNAFYQHIQKLTNSYFTKLVIYNDGELPNTICPICNSSKFVFSTDHYFSCEKNHYFVNNVQYFKAFLKEHLYLLESSNEPKISTDEIYNVFRSIPDQPRPDRFIAKIIRRYKSSTDILIISRKDNREEYKKFVDLVNNNLGSFFNIIVKEED